MRSAREAAGLTRADISSQTKIAERHLHAIEEDRFGDMAARTYAVGFARAYARALGLDETEIAAAVHAQIDAQEVDHPDAVSGFEPGDPARVPPLRLAWLAAGGAVVVIVLLLVFWSSFLSPEGKLPDLLPQQTVAPVASASASASTPAPAPAPAASDGPVVLTATADGIWVKVTDDSGKPLLEKTLAKGESWTVPADAHAPQLRTGRPDALQLAVGGKAIPPLATRPQTVSGVSLAGPVLLARTATAPAPGPAASASSSPQPARRPVVSRPAASAPQQAPSPQVPLSRVPSPSPSASSATPVTPPSASPRPAASPSLRPSAKPLPSPSATATQKPATALPTAPEPRANAVPAPQPSRTTEPLSTVSE
ncbi:helix-turn-helix domain-containing protein [Novosphingobium album (ex Hu et al. 2023)]|uniref:helix-turn-helix domain-containing protein n=1 Tax=Novosphingobium album (ex Hu et al. 2023) TaxID=2930093 RepID=UPI001FBBE7A4|nr:helix-turn-helix domain-containing protein [Novosphingobium album (ex Hu et al. 2023)]